MTDRADLRRLLRAGTDALLSAGVPDAALDSEYLLAEVLKVPRLNLLFNISSPVPPGAEEAYTALKTLGGSLEKQLDYTIPGTDTRHCAAIIRKTGVTPKRYPRRWAQIKSKPL